MEYTRENPYLAKLNCREVINPGSTKCTMKLTLDTSGSGIHYKCGDSIAVLPQNDHRLVLEIIEKLNANKDEKVFFKRANKELTFIDFLTNYANISRVSSKLFKRVIKEDSPLFPLLAPEKKGELKAYLENHELWDFFLENPPLDLTPQELTDMLTPILPRFYSIASAHDHSNQKIDLLIVYFEYNTNEHQRRGVGSHYLCELAPLHTPEIPMYLFPSSAFELPSNDTDIIMVGPGTGIAPFRAFIQERIAKNASGKNWLFFGERNCQTDFFYKDELEKYEKEGHLKLSLAFSRDQKEKVYVQDKMKENASELYKWLENGAVFYVCGDAQKMAKDVDQMLIHIVETEGNKSPEEAKEFVKQLKSEKRYMRDVY